MKKGFGDIFSETLKEFKLKFKTYSKAILLLYFLPMLIFSALFGSWLALNGFNLSFIENFTFSIGLVILLCVIFIIAIIIFTLYGIVLIQIALEKKDKGFKDAFQKSTKYFWAFLGLGILLGLCVGIGFLFLIIPGIILAVYFSLSEYAVIDKNIGPIKAMGESINRVKNNWWSVFGYGLLVLLMSWLVSIVFSIPEGIYDMISTFAGYLSEDLFVNPLQLALKFVFGIITALATFITTPFLTIFFKNIYLDLKKGK